jgi:hypothetical protein
VGNINISNSGSIAPGIGIESGIGIINATSVTLTSTSIVAIDVQPGVGAGSDQLLVSGSATLNGATLWINAGSNIVPGQTFRIMTHASGTFANLPEGAVVTSSSGASAKFHISYAGGPRHTDVVLTAF